MTDTLGLLSQHAARALTPEAIAERAFSQVKRGYAESEVRAYLRMVSSDFATCGSRERELASRVRELEEQLRKPVLHALRPGSHHRARGGDGAGARPGP